jgi:uncharacterized glyoxalase superfamily protein PhnB
MPAIKQTITPCLWFDSEAEEAAKFYVSVFENSRIRQISRYGEAGREVHGRTAGSVMVVEFDIGGQTFTALNGGPLFKFTEAISFQVMCDTPGRNRLFLEQACARRPRRPVRVAKGQIRIVLANRAVGFAADVGRFNWPKARPDDECRHEDDEV